MSSHRVILGFITVLVLTGCSDMQVPTGREALTHPLGTAPPFTRGTSKAKVLEAWGNPDYVVSHGSDELGNTREEWIYHGRVQSLPIDYEYVSRNKHLFFEGENLTRCTTDEKNAP